MTCENPSVENFPSVSLLFSKEKKKIKYLYSLNIILFGVTSKPCLTPLLRQSPHIKIAAVASHWQRVEDLIGSGFNPIPAVPEADIFPLVFYLLKLSTFLWVRISFISIRIIYYLKYIDLHFTQVCLLYCSSAYEKNY